MGLKISLVLPSLINETCQFVTWHKVIVNNLKISIFDDGNTGLGEHSWLLFHLLEHLSNMILIFRNCLIFLLLLLFLEGHRVLDSSIELVVLD